MKKNGAVAPQGESPESIPDFLPQFKAFTAGAFAQFIPEWMTVHQQKLNTIENKIMFQLPHTNRYY